MVRTVARMQVEGDILENENLKGSARPKTPASRCIGGTLDTLQSNRSKEKDGSGKSPTLLQPWTDTTTEEPGPKNWNKT